MKSPVGGNTPGNVKCRGKKTVLMSCRCCKMIDFRWDYKFRKAKDEIYENTQTKELHPISVDETRRRWFTQENPQAASW